MTRGTIRFIGGDSCNPGASTFSSLVPFCLPECEPIELVEPMQEPPMVVAPVPDPPNIDCGCFPIKTETTVTQFKGAAVFDLIVDYSRPSLSSGSGHIEYGDRDFCQPVITARLNVPPVPTDITAQIWPACVTEPFLWEGNNQGAGRVWLDEKMTDEDEGKVMRYDPDGEDAGEVDAVTRIGNCADQTNCGIVMKVPGSDEWVFTPDKQPRTAKCDEAGGIAHMATGEVVFCDKEGIATPVGDLPIERIKAKNLGPPVSSGEIIFVMQDEEGGFFFS